MADLSKLINNSKTAGDHAFNVAGSSRSSAYGSRARLIPLVAYLSERNLSSALCWAIAERGLI